MWGEVRGHLSAHGGVWGELRSCGEQLALLTSEPRLQPCSVDLDSEDLQRCVSLVPGIPHSPQPVTDVLVGLPLSDWFLGVMGH